VLDALRTGMTPRIPPLLELCLDAVVRHIHAVPSLADLPEELTVIIAHRLARTSGLSRGLLRFLFTGLRCQLSELDLSRELQGHRREGAAQSHAVPVPAALARRA
jgi:hypothetical protein